MKERQNFYVIRLLPKFSAQVVIARNGIQHVVERRLGNRFRGCRSWCRVDDERR